ncbi:MAG: universal stress protein [Candidatus Sulfotelmatobacter sp.]
MLSKCANPGCSSVFRYLHEGKLFLVTKAAVTPLTDPATDLLPTERFWLCDACSRKMRIAWDGSSVQLVGLRRNTKSGAWRAAQLVPRREYRKDQATAEGDLGGELETARTTPGEEGFMPAVAEWKENRIESCFRHILVATDFSEASRRALSDALALAAQYDARLSVLHAIPPEPALINLESPAELDLGRQVAQRRMKEFLSDIGPHHNVEHILLRNGPVAKVLDSVIREEKIDLLVIGTRGRGGLRKVALGSVAEELLRLAPCPVLTVGPKAEVTASANAAELHTVLFATDFGQGSQNALHLALPMAEANRAKLILLHMLPPLVVAGAGVYAFTPASAVAEEVQTWRTTAHADALKHLKACIPPDVKLSQEPEYIVETEFLPEGVLSVAALRRVDLIVMGANHAFSARAAAHYPWALVHEVVKNAACPVLTVAA